MTRPQIVRRTPQSSVSPEDILERFHTMFPEYTGIEPSDLLQFLSTAPEIEEIFENVGEEFPSRPFSPARAPVQKSRIASSATAAQTAFPIDVCELNSAVFVIADLPGISKESVKAFVDERTGILHVEVSSSRERVPPWVFSELTSHYTSENAEKSSEQTESGVEKETPSASQSFTLHLGERKVHMVARAIRLPRIVDKSNILFTSLKDGVLTIAFGKVHETSSASRHTIAIN